MEDIRFFADADINVENIGFVSVLRNENYVFEYKNGKENHSFIYVQSGALDYYFNGTACTVGSGAVIFIPKRLPYKAIYRKNSTVIKIITFDVSAGRLPPYLCAPMANLSPECAYIFEQITEKNMRSTLYLASKTYGLIYLLQQTPQPMDKKYKNILPAVRHIERNCAENQKISFYADMCGMCESNFRRLFKEYTGSSVIEYRNGIRIEEVKKMLDSGEFTVGQAAYAAGFNNMSFFYSVYNKKRK